MLDDIASVTMRTALSSLSARQRVSADNIANIETPNYRASRVSFESSLRDAVASGDPARATASVEGTGDTPGVNGNNVNLDAETIIDQKTQLQYQLLASALSGKYSLLSTVIKG